MRWKNASAFTGRAHSARNTRGRIFFAVCIRPLAQRACCDLKAFISTGNSEGHSISGKIEELPAAHLRAIGKVGVFGERIVLPAAGVFNGVAAPDAGGAVEIEKQAAAEARAVLDGEMAVEQDGFDFGERGIVAVDVAPARLHHGEFRIREIRHGAAQEIGGRNEIGVEDGDEFARGGFQSFLQRARFEAFAIVAMDVENGQAESLKALDAIAGDFAAFRRWNRRAPECRAVRAGNRIGRRPRRGARSHSARCRWEAGR